MSGKSRPPAIIDCDLHSTVPSIAALVPYMPRYWREYVAQTSYRGPIHDAYPTAAATSVRPDFRQAQGGTVALDLAHMRQHALDPWQTALGILNCSYGVESLHSPDAEASLASALNEWHLAEWLEPEPRLRAALAV